MKIGGWSLLLWCTQLSRSGYEGVAAAPQQQQQQQQQSLETGPIVINAIIAVVSTSDDGRVVQEG